MESPSTTLFIDNISSALHWKGLWFAFARHGDIVDVFVPRKRSKSGRRFGFVRYAKKADAMRAIERLHRFTLFGSHISVTLARNTDRKNFWRKRSDGSDISLGNDQNEAGNTLASEKMQNGVLQNQKKGKENEGGEPNNRSRMEIKRLVGHVEDEDL
ncbi:hypothetical protein HRI_000867800 [Hibiscus trionum]|uniref:RRM domain-containing protein n=1 Tax=Hibiscus trionum TaxID=183268 RepID=A0A9W7H6Q4_HIBTR|nr:hypothetical protein HRI_000867800 [Hibiscus trionum]